MSSRRLNSLWGLLLLVTLGGAQAWGGDRHGRLSAPVHRPTLSPGQGLRPVSGSRETFRLKKPQPLGATRRPLVARPPVPSVAKPMAKPPLGGHLPVVPKPLPVLPHPPVLGKQPPSGPPEYEPPPAGEVAVRWAIPKRRDLGVKIHTAPSYSANVIGELRGQSAMLVGQQIAAKVGLCRTWLSALPSGFVCESDVTVEPGYLSSPPAQEKSTGWQRLRYGVVSSFMTKLRGGGSHYLRQVLHKGDGVTITQEKGEEVQIIGQKWLPRRDVQVFDPPVAPPVALDTVPPGLRLGWAVPPMDEEGVPVFLPKSDSGPVAYLPRYAVVYVVENSDSTPGRLQVVFPESTRAVLRAPGSSRPAWVSSPQFEIEVGQLRRMTTAAPPADLLPDERWIDIHLLEQVATAYQGKKPLFASLVSTGLHGATPPGSFFIYRKYLTQTMANLAGAASQYDFREVPHAQFFNGRIGLHAVLWHDRLGHPVSHGCVNLSPPAAEQFFAFTSPDLPVGWHSVTTFAHQGGPRSAHGTRVVVRK